jgi:hypothetical protein
MKRLLLLIIPIASLLSGCQKYIGIRNQTLSRHNWKMTEHLENGIDVLKDCEKDDTYYFYGNQSGKVDEGNNICDSTIVVGSQGQDSIVAMHQLDFGWSVTGDQKIIYLYHFGDPNYNPGWTILDMDETKFHIKGIDQRNGITITYYKTFEAINNL